MLWDKKTACGRYTQWTVAAIGSGAALTLLGCSQPAAEDAVGTPKESDAAVGTLQIEANGEDFVRQGFTTKDGWDITFDRVDVKLANIAAYQAEPAFDPDQDKSITTTQSPAEIAGPVTVDLAAGDETANPIIIGAVETAAGRYNALTWELVAADEPALVMVGTATQAGTEIPFTIAMAPALKFTCGDFVGETRKGFLEAGDTATVEATFHFDHLFGDVDLPADDYLNQKSLGFEPFAALANNGQVDLSPQDLEANLSPQDYQQLQIIFEGLGHVGEGHCQSQAL
ncbi:MAG: DUF4382 domain-containing protein [Cyanobacteria bacterium J06632_22]